MSMKNCSDTIETATFRFHRGADKSLARPGRKQVRKHVRDARDFNSIETRAVNKFFFSLQGKAPKEIHAILTEKLACFLPGRLRTYQHPCSALPQTSAPPRAAPELSHI